MAQRSVAVKAKGTSRSASRRLKMAMLIGGGFLLTFVVLAVVGIQAWEYSNSVPFCTEACHDVHPEEPVAYENSYHAEVKCTECHMGRVSTLRAITIKAGHFRHLPAILFDSYERPTESTSMRPANESCERCHWSSAFHDNTAREIVRFLPDSDNTMRRTYLLLKTGEGTPESGQGFDIHWHIANRIEYIAADEHKQEILWVKAALPDGQTIEYHDLGSPLPPEQIAQADKRVMDCVDCHNRIGHQFPSPQDLIDQALADGGLSPSLPYGKKALLDLLTSPYPDQASALAAADSLPDRYRKAYAALADEYPAELEQASRLARELAVRLIFAEPGISWQSFNDNSGHLDSPGCFRCHDGLHASTDGETIRLQCNLCHNIPITVDAGQDPPDLPYVSLDQPADHLTSNFVRDHRFLADNTCTECHGEISYGSDDSSFCANSACHAQDWPRLDLDAGFSHPAPLEGGHAEATCYDCHSGEWQAAYRCADCHEPPDRPHYGSECRQCHSLAGFDGASAVQFEHSFQLEGKHRPAACDSCHDGESTQGTECSSCHLGPEGHLSGACSSCHTPADWAESARQASLGAPPLPHSLDLTADCLVCHDPEGQNWPAPSDHLLRSADQCSLCHIEASPLRLHIDPSLIYHDLLGLHAEVDCRQCHIDGLFQGTPTACSTCHEERGAHTAAIGSDCAVCHGPSSWSEITYDHSQAAFLLLGRHQDIGCGDCHLEDVYAGTPQFCSGCHQADDAHSGQFGLDCAQCHTPSSWTGASFDHQQTGYALTGAHIEAPCMQCHQNNVYSGTPQACASCHAEQDKHAGAFGQDCASCHSTDGWGGASFDHNSTAFALTGAHVSAPCVQCHAGGNYAGTPQSCASCHSAQDKHSGALGQDCARCHNTSGWGGATFDHSNTAFALTGAHVSAPCIRCHAGGSYSGTPQACVSCHAPQDKHGGGFGQDCARCHNTSGWGGASFDHGSTGFALTGAHAGAACTQCHGGGAYAGTPQACAACHGEPGYHAGILGTECASCHSTTGWLPAAYNRPHSFPFDHEDAGWLSCRACHPGSLASTSCDRCHEEEEKEEED